MAAKYVLLNLRKGGTFVREFILKTPRKCQVYPSYEAAKSAFNKMNKAKKWMLFHDFYGDLTIYVNHEVDDKRYIVVNKI